MNGLPDLRLPDGARVVRVWIHHGPDSGWQAVDPDDLRFEVVEVELVGAS